MLKKLKLNTSIRPTRPSRTNTPKRCPFHYRGLECKSKKSRDTWSNRQIWPWSKKQSRAKANRVSPRERIGHSKPSQEKTLHMDITRWSILKSDCLHSLQPFRYDLNQIPYDYTVEVKNRFKGLIDRVPDELWTKVREIVQETGIKTIPMEKYSKKQNGCLRRPYI